MENIKFLRKIHYHQNELNFIDKKYNLICKKIFKIRKKLNNYNYYLINSYNKKFYIKNFKNIHDLNDYRESLNDKIIVFNSKIKMYDNILTFLHKKHVILTNNIVYYNILLNKCHNQ